jgi:hypothetical protein
VELLGREQDRHALPSGLGNESGLGAGRCRQDQTGTDLEPVHRPLRVRTERNQGEQVLTNAPRPGPDSQVCRQKDDGGGVEANRHPSSLQGHRLKLRHILVDQLDIGASDCRIADFDDADGSLLAGYEGRHHTRVLRNSDRRHLIRGRS